MKSVAAGCGHGLNLRGAYGHQKLSYLFCTLGLGVGKFDARPRVETSKI